MKMIVSVLLGFVGAILIALVYSSIIILTGWDINSFKLFFIIPVGAFLLGMGSTTGIYLGLRILNLKHEKGMQVLDAIIALVCFIGIYFFIYSFTYVSSDNTINYRFDGIHISNYSFYGSNEPIDFFSYMSNDISSRKSTGFFTFGRTGAGVPIGSFGADSSINWILFLIECAGFMLGGVIRADGLRGTFYCEECRKYLKRRKIATFKIAEFESLIPDESNIEIEKLVEIAKEKKKVPFYYLGNHKRIDVRYCPECNKGTIILNQMEFEVYKFEERPIKRKKFEVDSSIIGQLL